MFCCLVDISVDDEFRCKLVNFKVYDGEDMCYFLLDIYIIELKLKDVN